MGKRHPSERDCQKLVSDLLQYMLHYMQSNPGMFCGTGVNGSDGLHSVC